MRSLSSPEASVLKLLIEENTAYYTGPTNYTLIQIKNHLNKRIFFLYLFSKSAPM